MKAYYLLAPLGAIALSACTVYRPVAYEPAVVTTPAAVAVTPAVVTTPNTTVLGSGPVNPKQVDSDGDGYPDAIDQFPNDARYH